MKNLSIDLECYSSVDLAKSGLYRYAESPDFEILLFGYSVDNGPVRVVDLANGEEIPSDVLDALTDDNVIKWAFNSSYERICLSRYLADHGRSLDPFYDQHPLSTECARFLNPRGWRCTMIWSAYLGLPLSLKGAGAVLDLEQQKMAEGKELIKYFCVPCAPTLVNGMRTRNLPDSAPEKWETFKSYNQRDVEVELAIQQRLQKYPVPEDVWDQYHIDQEINDRGIALDMPLVESAIRMDELSRQELTEAMKRLTSLENPNSVQQMKRWLADNGMETDTLGKKAVEDMLKDCPQELREVLQLRLKLAKSSVRKYVAMENAVCADGRARGMFQFYGANRTGRWCLTGDHEVLTPNGWRRLDEWDGGPIACWNANTEGASFKTAKSLCFDYSGPMYTYCDTRIDQCSTPDHKMRVQRYDGSWRDMTVEQMASGRPTIPLFGRHYHRGCANPAWLRVLIMTQADGFYTTDGGVRFNFKKQRKIERCKSLLRKAEIPYVVHVLGDVTSIAIPARALPLWMRQFRSKTFGYWLLEENPDIFFDELPYWDGYQSTPNRIEYTTCNKQNADIAQALAHLSGRSATIHVRKAKCATHNDAYEVDIRLTPKNTHKITTDPVITDYTGKVYCAETPTGYFLVRRSGKVWVTGNSGKLIQLQNLSRNSMPDLDAARQLVRSGDFETVKCLYPDVPDTLSQLVRTAFIPRKGRKFIVSDFSAIEARVIAWLAGEQWRLDAFASGVDIYCASASQMFGVPVVKHGINGELRQKGKIAELACIAKGQLVLTDYDLVPIEAVTMDMRLWDGEEWVEHGGVICRGEREVITYDGLTATPDHLVWAEEQPEPVEFGIAAASGAHLLRCGDGRQPGILPSGTCGTLGATQHNAMQCTTQHNAMQRALYEAPQPYPTRTAMVYDILDVGPRHRFTVSSRLVHNCGYGGSVGALKAMGALEMGLQEDNLKPLVDSWRAANPNIVQLWWDVDEAVLGAVNGRGSITTHGLIFECEDNMLLITLPSGRRLVYARPKIGTNRFGSPCVTYEGIGATKKWERIESYGPKFVENCIAEGTLIVTDHGLVPIEEVCSDMRIWDGTEWVEHNGLIARGVKETICVDGIRMTPEHKILTKKGWMAGAEAEGLEWADATLPESYPCKAMQIPQQPSMDAGSGIILCSIPTPQQVYDIRNCGPRHRFAVWNGERICIVSNCVQAIARDILAYAMQTLRCCDIVAHVHDELIIEADLDASVEAVCEQMSRTPPWAEGLPLRADGYETPYYKKD